MYSQMKTIWVTLTSRPHFLVILKSRRRRLRMRYRRRSRMCCMHVLSAAEHTYPILAFIPIWRTNIRFPMQMVRTRPKLRVNYLHNLHVYLECMKLFLRQKCLSTATSENTLCCKLTLWHDFWQRKSFFSFWCVYMCARTYTHVCVYMLPVYKLLSVFMAVDMTFDVIWSWHWLV